MQELRKILLYYEAIGLMVGAFKEKISPVLL